MATTVLTYAPEAVQAARTKYPMYKEYSDDELMDGIHMKHYTTWTKDDFIQAMNDKYAPPPPPPQPNLFEKVGNIVGGIGPAIMGAAAGISSPGSEAALGVAKDIGKGLIEDVKSVAHVASGVAGALSPLGVTPEQRKSFINEAVTSAPRAAANIGSILAGVKAEQILANVTENLIARAAGAGATFGGTYNYIQSTMEGRPLPEVAGSTLKGAALGAVVGSSAAGILQGAKTISGVPIASRLQEAPGGNPTVITVSRAQHFADQDVTKLRAGFPDVFEQLHNGQIQPDAAATKLMSESSVFDPTIDNSALTSLTTKLDEWNKAQPKGAQIDIPYSSQPSAPNLIGPPVPGPAGLTTEPAVPTTPLIEPNAVNMPAAPMATTPPIEGTATSEPTMVPGAQPQGPTVTLPNYPQIQIPLDPAMQPTVGYPQTYPAGPIPEPNLKPGQVPGLESTPSFTPPEAPLPKESSVRVTGGAPKSISKKTKEAKIKAEQKVKNLKERAKKVAEGK